MQHLKAEIIDLMDKQGAPEFKIDSMLGGGQGHDLFADMQHLNLETPTGLGQTNVMQNRQMTEQLNYDKVKEL